jgi:hypothetical protein
MAIRGKAVTRLAISSAMIFILLSTSIVLLPPCGGTASVPHPGGMAFGLAEMERPIAVATLRSLATTGHFTKNCGQISDRRVIFSSGNALFTPDGVFFRVRQDQGSGVQRFPDHNGIRPAGGQPRVETGTMAVYRAWFIGANPVMPCGRGELAHQSNFFIGSERSRWAANVPNYAEIVYEGLYDGIDIAYRAVPQGMKYEFRVSPGADISLIRMAYEGARPALDGDSILLHTPAGTAVDGDLAFLQERDGAFDAVPGGARLDGGVVSFEAQYDHGSALVIDPLVFSTFLGGEDDDDAYGMAADADGNIVVSGNTMSSDFPTTVGCYADSPSSYEDVFVAKLKADGSGLLFATYLGGDDSETYPDVRVDSAGNVYVSTYTYSADFPTTAGAFDRTLGGMMDTFVAKLSPDGSRLVYSTFVGGRDDEFGAGLSVDGSGCAYIVGNTESSDYPTTVGAYSRTLKGVGDVFVTKLNTGGSGLVFSTLVGGDADEVGLSVFVDSSSNALVTGWTTSDDFPVTGGVFQSRFGGSYDGFASRISADGASILKSTFLGGMDDDLGVTITQDAAGCVYIIGETMSDDFPTTTGCLDSTLGGYSDAFALKAGQDMSALAYSTYLGGSSYEEGNGLSLASSGAAVVVGRTSSSGFPVTTDALDRQLSGSSDGYISMLDPGGTKLLHSTFLGGTDSDVAQAVVRASPGIFCIAGATYSTDFSTTVGAYCRTFCGSDYYSETFVCGLQLPDETAAPSLWAAAGDKYVQLGWVPASKPGLPAITGYNVHRGTAPGPSGVLASLGNQTGYNDTGVANGVLYFYCVAPVYSQGEGEMSNVVQVAPGTFPGPARNIVLAAGNRCINLTWEPPTDNGGLPILGYVVYRDEDGGSPQRYQTIGNTTRFTDYLVFNGTVYTYAVAAYNARGEGPLGLTVSGSPGRPPSAPSGLLGWGENQTIHLAWKAPKDAAVCPPDGYIVRRWNDTRAWLRLGPCETTSFDDVLGQSETKIWYNVTAFNVFGESGPSPMISLECPGAPSGLVVDVGSEGTNLSWRAPSGDGGCAIHHYNVYRSVNGAPAEILFSSPDNHTTCSLSGALYDPGVGYYVSAQNAVGEGVRGSLRFAAPDQTVPEITIAGPPAVTFTNRTVVDVWGTARDIVGVMSVDVSAGGELWTRCTGTTEWRASVALPEGTSVVKARATDRAGNTNGTTVSVTVDIWAPRISVNVPADGAFVISERLQASGTVTDSSPLGAVELSTDGTAWHAAIGTSTWSGELALRPGANTLYVRASDAAGNSNITTTKVFLDTRDPAISVLRPGQSQHITAGPSGKVVTFMGSASDDMGLESVELSADGETWVTANGTTSWSCGLALSRGAHQVFFRVTDIAGRQSTAEIDVVLDPEVSPSMGWEIVAVPAAFLVVGVALGLLLSRLRKGKRT